MKQVIVLAEGQTEETFLDEVLAPRLLQHEVALSITLLKTKILDDAPDYKGGVATYGQIRRDLINLLQGKKDICVTTMIDFYGLPTDTPGMGDPRTGDCYEQVSHIEHKIEANIGNPLLKVFLMLHEFEAFAFIDPKLILQLYPSEREAVNQLNLIRNGYPSPEHINREKPPSKRIQNLLKDYKKTIDGPLIASELSIDRIAAECKHFREWLQWLQSQ